MTKSRGPKLHVVQSIPKYIATIEKIVASDGRMRWFRGNSSATHRLLPSVLRKSFVTADARLNPVADERRILSDGYRVSGPSPQRLLDEFKKLRFFAKRRVQPKNDFEWLFLMQHYGVHTRLLDWSTNALV